MRLKMNTIKIQILSLLLKIKEVYDFSAMFAFVLYRGMLMDYNYLANVLKVKMIDYYNNFKEDVKCQN